MWVLVIVNLKTNAVEVRGPWNDYDVASGAAMAYRRINEALDDEEVIVTVSGIQPMVYFKPEWRGGDDV